MAAQAPGRLGSGGGLDSPAGLSASERAYGALLGVYPSEFRRRYASEMVLLFGDQLRDARTSNGAGGVAATWFRTLIDLASSALGEHLRKDRTMAQSLATFEPTRWMRLLGALAIVGGLLLIGVFFWTGLFAGPDNTVRLVLFALAGPAVAVALHPRQAVASPQLAAVATAIVVIAGAWYISTNLLSLNRPSPWAGVGGVLYSLSSFSIFVSPSIFGLLSLRIGAAWLGMTRWFAATTRMALLTLVVGGPLAALGDDRWGFTDDPVNGALITQLTLLGVFLTGAACALLGFVLALAGRKPPAAR